jgi:hypothetical protein
MPAPTQGRVRLERALIRVHRAGGARGPEGRRHTVPASPGPVTERSATAASAPEVVPAPRAEPEAAAPRAEPEAAETPAEADAPAAPQAPPADGLVAIVERLRGIEERLAALQSLPRPAAASAELFAEWVRMRHWQEIPFGEFLKLRRAGRI